MSLRNRNPLHRLRSTLSKHSSEDDANNVDRADRQHAAYFSSFPELDDGDALRAFQNGSRSERLLETKLSGDGFPISRTLPSIHESYASTRRFTKLRQCFSLGLNRDIWSTSSDIDYQSLPSASRDTVFTDAPFHSALRNCLSIGMSRYFSADSGSNSYASAESTLANSTSYSIFSNTPHASELNTPAIAVIGGPFSTLDLPLNRRYHDNIDIDPIAQTHKSRRRNAVHSAADAILPHDSSADSFAESSSVSIRMCGADYDSSSDSPVAGKRPTPPPTNRVESALSGTRVELSAPVLLVNSYALGGSSISKTLQPPVHAPVGQQGSFLGLPFALSGQLSQGPGGKPTGLQLAAQRVYSRSQKFSEESQESDQSGPSKKGLMGFFDDLNSKLSILDINNAERERLTSTSGNNAGRQQTNEQPLVAKDPNLANCQFITRTQDFRKYAEFLGVDVDSLDEEETDV